MLYFTSLTSYVCSMLYLIKFGKGEINSAIYVSTIYIYSTVSDILL